MGDFRDPEVVERWHASQLSHPARGEQLDLLLEALARAGPRRVLDLGVGSGLVAERVLDRLPDASLVGFDYSPAMLSRARGRLERFGRRAVLAQADLAAPEATPLPTGPYDAAISVQTLHNIRPAGQQRAIAWLGRSLAPDGLALLLDKFAIPERLYRAYAGLAGLPPDFASYAATERANQEWSASLDTQLRWLETAGLQAGALDLRANYALLVARPRLRTSEAAHQR